MCPASRCPNGSESETAVFGACAALADIGRLFRVKTPNQFIGQALSIQAQAITREAEADWGR